MESVTGPARHPLVKVAFMVVVLILLIVIYMNVKPKKEGYVDFANKATVSDYGIKQRFGGTFTGTNQGEQSVVYNDTLKALIPGLIPRRNENLVGGREPPVFNEIGSELDAYRSASMSDGAVQSQAASEKFTDPRRVTNEVEENLLANSIGLRTF